MAKRWGQRGGQQREGGRDAEKEQCGSVGGGKGGMLEWGRAGEWGAVKRGGEEIVKLLASDR
ncbi:hypothetical protein, partial [Salmonella enterica]|uniref:hypothetical protein n=1 Tax=Salmonella enterica TaxID=28901 RepID=UPI00398C706E